MAMVPTLAEPTKTEVANLLPRTTQADYLRRIPNKEDLEDDDDHFEDAESEDEEHEEVVEQNPNHPPPPPPRASEEEEKNRKVLAAAVAQPPTPNTPNTPNTPPSNPTPPTPERRRREGTEDQSSQPPPPPIFDPAPRAHATTTAANNNNNDNNNDNNNNNNNNNNNSNSNKSNNSSSINAGSVDATEKEVEKYKKEATPAAEATSARQATSPKAAPIPSSAAETPPKATPATASTNTASNNNSNSNSSSPTSKSIPNKTTTETTNLHDEEEEEEEEDAESFVSGCSDCPSMGPSGGTLTGRKGGEDQSLRSNSEIVLEASLLSWELCFPEGYIAQEYLVTSKLAEISSNLPGKVDSKDCSDMLNYLFKPANDEDGRSIFVRLLKARNGTVHFLHFWRAFADVTRMLGSATGGVLDSEPSKDTRGELLPQEVELARDTILRSLDEDDPTSPYLEQRLQMGKLIELVRSTASMSLAPDFWGAILETLGQGSADATLDWDELTAMIVAWLRDSASFASAPVGASFSAPCSEPEPERTESSSSRPSTSSRSAPRASVEQGLPVWVHIYDVSHEDNVHKLNKVLAHQRNPFKFGGVFHAGVEVNGLEWSFGMSCMESVPGISCSLPKEHSEHRYRQSVRLKDTRLSPEDVAALITDLIEEYPGDDYDLLRRNCCHFADDFVRRLGSGRLPGWVHRLARLGAFVDGAMQRIANRSLLGDDAYDDW